MKCVSSNSCHSYAICCHESMLPMMSGFKKEDACATTQLTLKALCFLFLAWWRFCKYTQVWPGDTQTTSIAKVLKLSTGKEVTIAKFREISWEVLLLPLIILPFFDLLNKCLCYEYTLKSSCFTHVFAPRGPAKKRI